MTHTKFEKECKAIFLDKHGNPYPSTPLEDQLEFYRRKVWEIEEKIRIRNEGRPAVQFSSKMKK